MNVVMFFISAVAAASVCGFFLGMYLADRMWEPLHQEAYDGWFRNVLARLRDRREAEGRENARKEFDETEESV